MGTIVHKVMQTLGDKKLAIIIFGWHFPFHYYEAIKNQTAPEGWSIDYFCVSHRSPNELEPSHFIENSFFR